MFLPDTISRLRITGRRWSSTPKNCCRSVTTALRIFAHTGAISCFEVAAHQKLHLEVAALRKDLAGGEKRVQECALQLTKADAVLRGPLQDAKKLLEAGRRAEAGEVVGQGNTAYVMILCATDYNNVVLTWIILLRASEVYTMSFLPRRQRRGLVSSARGRTQDRGMFWNF